MINVFQPSLGNEELSALKKVIESNWVGRGSLTAKFEHEFAAYCGVNAENMRALSSCTAGLFVSMPLLNIGAGAEVILPTISFIGAGNAIKFSGAQPVFCDVDRRSLNATAELIERKITKNTKAILLLHYGGIPCEMDDILFLAQKNNLYVIEDNACSVASKYKGKFTGTLGDIGIWSFDAMKILVCGDGGMLFAKDKLIRDKADEMLYFGLKTKSGFSNFVDNKWWEFDISYYGNREIMNDMAASIGLEQLKKLNNFINRRHQIFDMYNAGLKNVDWIDLPLTNNNNIQSSYYFYHIQVKNDKRDNLAVYLRKNNIYTTFRYYPLHLVNFYNCNEKYENAEYAANHTLCLPIHQSLTNNDVDYIIEKIKEFKWN